MTAVVAILKLQIQHPVAVWTSESPYSNDKFLAMFPTTKTTSQTVAPAAATAVVPVAVGRPCTQVCRTYQCPFCCSCSQPTSCCRTSTESPFSEVDAVEIPSSESQPAKSEFDIRPVTRARSFRSQLPKQESQLAKSSALAAGCCKSSKLLLLLCQYLY